MTNKRSSLYSQAISNMKVGWIPPIDSQSGHLEKLEIGVGSEVHTCGQEGHLCSSLLSLGEVLSLEKVLSRTDCTLRIILGLMGLVILILILPSTQSVTLTPALRLIQQTAYWDRLELGEVPVPGDLGSRGSQRPSPVIPGTLSRQRSTQLQPRLARRSDWWSPPPCPLYGSLYDRPRYTTAWGTPVSGATGLQVIARVVPDVGDQEADRVGDGTRGVSPPGPPVQEDTG